ncbi:MAG: HAD family hydrolase [Oscillospiraceae bacterium]|nr:HAD family hydrolase [Oscillospiraceae bacterium]
MASYGMIFDLDGTLAYTLEDIATAVNNTLSKLGYKTRTKAEILKFINNGARELVRRALPKTVQDVEFIVDSALDVYGEEYSKCYLEKTQVYDGITEVLAEQKKNGVKLAVLSNKQDAFVKNIVYTLFGKKLFTVVQGQASGMIAKPDPTSTLQACKQMGVKPSNCLFIGDSDVDIQTAQNAQITSIGVAWGYREREVLEEAQADFIVETPADLYNVLTEQISKMKQASKSKK